MGNALLENLVGFKANCVKKTRTPQEFINVRCSEGGIASEIAAKVPFPVTLNDGFQNIPPSVSAVDIAGAQATPLQIANWLNRNSGW